MKAMKDFTLNNVVYIAIYVFAYRIGLVKFRSNI